MLQGKKFPSLFYLTANENCYEMNITPSRGDFFWLSLQAGCGI